jgi:hypothetical protein
MTGRKAEITSYRNPMSRSRRSNQLGYMGNVGTWGGCGIATFL